MATPIRIGTDSSGRPILMTPYMRDWLDAVKRDPTVTPFAGDIVVTQGAFMLQAGGGAAASAGYHDLAGCIDFRTWNLTGAQLEAFIRACRRRGGAAWRRDLTAAHGGMDPHCHVTLGGDFPKSGGAQDSWNQYVSGSNGLTGSSHGPDYEWRPSPLVLKFTPSEEDDNMTPEDRQWFDARFDRIEKRLAAVRSGSAAREQAIISSLEELEAEVADDATKEQLKRTRLRLVAELEKDEAADAPEEAPAKSFESSHKDPSKP